MASLRSFILLQSSLTTGNVVRDHIKNPAAIGGGGGGFIYSKEPIQVNESEILQVSNSELIQVSEAVVLTIETDQVLVTNNQAEIIEVTDGEN